MSDHTLELTRDQQDLLLQGLRFVRSAVALNMQEFTPDVEAERRQKYERINELESLLRMLGDDEWQLPESDRERLLATFVYFADPEDILPDDVPVIGYLDDVIIIEIVARELTHVREAYDDFCEFREGYDKRFKTGHDAAVRRDLLATALERNREEVEGSTCSRS